ncbi:MAG: YybH family protein [Candidatus Acidiferrales bacterium]
MTRRILVAELLLVVSAIAFLPRWEAFGLRAETPGPQDVLEVVREFQSAGIRGDGAALTQIFDPNVTHFHPGSPYRFVGRDRLIQEFEVASRSQQDMHFEMVDPQVQMAAKDVAVVTYYIVESWADKNGVRTSAKEKATEVYANKEGHWTMIHGHYSTE